MLPPWAFSLPTPHLALVSCVPKSCSSFVEHAWSPLSYSPHSSLPSGGRGAAFLCRQEASHRASTNWLPFPGARNILKIFVTLLATGGYNSLLAESKPASCQGIPEAISVIQKCKNKRERFNSHPHLSPAHKHVYSQPSQELHSSMSHIILFVPSLTALDLQGRWSYLCLGHTEFVGANQVQANYKVKSERLSFRRGLWDLRQGKGCILSLLCNPSSFSVHDDH